MSVGTAGFQPAVAGIPAGDPSYDRRHDAGCCGLEARAPHCTQSGIWRPADRGFVISGTEEGNLRRLFANERSLENYEAGNL